MLKQLAAQGGLFMVTFVPEFLSQPVWDAVTPLKDAHGKTRPDVTRERVAHGTTGLLGGLAARWHRCAVRHTSPICVI